MILAGELDAAFASAAIWRNDQDFKCLFSDPIAEDIRYYRKTRLLSINHQAVGCFDK
jgi:hypothetical protein